MKIVKEYSYKKTGEEVDAIKLELRDGSHLFIEDYDDATNGVRILGDRGNAKHSAHGVCVQPVSGNVITVFTCPLGRPTTHRKEDKS